MGFDVRDLPVPVREVFSGCESRLDSVEAGEDLGFFSEDLDRTVSQGPSELRLYVDVEAGVVASDAAEQGGSRK